MSKISLTLLKSTSSSKGGYINTWGTAVSTDLGKMYGEGSKYYTKSIDELTPGKEVSIDLRDWDVRESSFTDSDGNEHTTQWLSPRS